MNANRNWFAFVVYRYASICQHIDSIRMRHNHVPCMYARICVQGWVDSLLAYGLSHRAHIYKYTISQLRYNHVITMSYLKCCCVLTQYYVFAIKFKYYGRKKVRHYAHYLHRYYDYSVFPSIHIVFSKSPILP